MKLLTTLLVIPVLAVAAVACGGDDEPDETPTSAPTLQAPTEAAQSPTVAATVTTAPSTNTPAPTGTTAPEVTPPPTDGTVYPQNPGSTDPFPIKSNPDPSTETYTINDVRVGAHPESGGWDRIVFEFEDIDGQPGGRPSGMVQYEDDIVQCGSGEPVEVDGEAILTVRFDGTRAHDDNGQLTIDSIEVEGPGNSILQAVSYCDFEGVVQWAIGVPEELNYKVTFLESASRVVIDIKWP